ncbi:hypothetical protein SP19_174 [Salmonella phage 19]|nr:hypothetical protein SP19_174 [Salmonella phage 19]
MEVSGLQTINPKSKTLRTVERISHDKKVDTCSRLEGLHNHAEFTLHLPYIPYARQDRVMNPGEALSIKVFDKKIGNSLEFDKPLDR